MNSGTYHSRCSAIYTKALLESQAPIYEKRDLATPIIWEKEDNLGVKTPPMALCNWLYIATSCVFFLYHNQSLLATSCTMFSGEEMPSRSGGRVRKNHRSACVMNMMVEMFGDPWSLLVIRDILFMNRRHFRELLTKSLEGIASNILADRLQRLVQQGIIVKSRDPAINRKPLTALRKEASNCSLC